MTPVSIIMPVFNVEDVIEDALSSIRDLDQPVELIIIDGRSTDRTLKILESFHDLISVLISEPDQGIYDAMNKGIQMASKDWFYFMGADDRLADGAVFSELLRDVKDELILHGAVENINRKSTKVPIVHYTQFNKTLYWKNSMHHQGVIYHRCLFEDYRFNLKYSVLADYDLNLAFLKRQIPAGKRNLLICKSMAIGISKRFNISLYIQELQLKYHRLPLMFFLLNIPWVLVKFIYKNLKL